MNIAFIEPEREVYIPFESPLPEFFPFNGYVEPDGTIHKCDNFKHVQTLRKIIHEKYFEEYNKKCSPGICFKKPFDMDQEEYFAMKYLNFVKIKLARGKEVTVNTLFRYNDLTPEQIKVIYPQ